jgi:hypothetical protein
MIEGAALPASVYLNAFWQHAKMYPKQTSRHLYGIYTYNQQIDEVRLRFALQQLVDNHGTLRTGFNIQNSKLHLLTKSHPQKILTTHEVASVHEENILINQLIAETFDVMQDDLFKFHLINRHNPKGSIFVIIFHHIMLDGSLFDYFVNKINAYYENYQKENQCDIHLENDLKNHLENEPLRINPESITFWNERLSSYPLAINMPFVNKSESLSEQETCTTRFFISAALTKEIENFLLDYQVSIFNFLKIIWATLIGHYAQQDKLIIIHAVSIRAQKLKHLEGSFINILPFPLDLNKSLDEELVSTTQMVDDLKSHRFLPMEKIIEGFFQTTMQTKFDNALKVVFAQTDLRILPPRLMQENVNAYPTPNIGSAYLLLEYQRLSDQIAFQLNYLSPAISEARMEQMKMDFVHLIKIAIKNPKIKLSELKLENLECHDLTSIKTIASTHFFQHKGAKW